MNNPPTNKRPSVGFILGKSGAYAFLILGLVATLLPFFYIMVSSLKTEAELRYALESDILAINVGFAGNYVASLRISRGRPSNLPSRR